MLEQLYHVPQWSQEQWDRWQLGRCEDLDGAQQETILLQFVQSTRVPLRYHEQYRPLWNKWTILFLARYLALPPSQQEEMITRAGRLWSPMKQVGVVEMLLMNHCDYFLENPQTFITITRGIFETDPTIGETYSEIERSKLEYLKLDPKLREQLLIG